MFAKAWSTSCERDGATPCTMFCFCTQLNSACSTMYLTPEILSAQVHNLCGSISNATTSSKGARIYAHSISAPRSCRCKAERRHEGEPFHQPRPATKSTVNSVEWPLCTKTKREALLLGGHLCTGASLARARANLSRDRFFWSDRSRRCTSASSRRASITSRA